jgi:hypothetical protein
MSSGVLSSPYSLPYEEKITCRNGHGVTALWRNPSRLGETVADLEAAIGGREVDSGMERLVGLCREHGIALAYLFGSQRDLGLRLLRGEPISLSDPLADIDVSVVMGEPLPGPDVRYRLYSRIHNALTDLFPGAPLDLVFLQENHAVFQAEAVLGRCAYAVSEARRNDYEHRILARAADFRPVLDLFYRERLEEVGR